MQDMILNPESHVQVLAALFGECKGEVTRPPMVDGKLTDKALGMLKERMPHVDFSGFEADPRVDQMSEVFTVGSLVDFIERKMQD